MTSVQKHFSLSSLYLLLFSCFLTVSSSITTITNITTDQLALLALKSQITESSSTQILAKNWTMDSPVCSWIGVSCGSQNRRVTALDLSNMNLTGTLLPHLGNLTFLVSLNLSANNFNGELPDEFSRFRRLKALNLSLNHLNGQFPQWIGSLEELEYFSVFNNSFTGEIPESISNMSKLTAFVASYNKLQGKIPQEIFNMSVLERISLSANSFSSGSSLPDNLCHLLPVLKRLDLKGAGLTGQIPSTIGLCSQLQRLVLPSNSLNGLIPREIGLLKGVFLLDLGNNRLEGAIPREIGNMSLLQILNIDNNNLTGVIPEEIGKLSSIQQIYLGNNTLTGSIPANIFNLSAVMWIDLRRNNLFGNLPSTMGYTLPSLRELYLGSNMISGVLPNSISNCSNLSVLELFENHFSGPIPNFLGDLPFLRCLHLQNNKFTREPSSQVLNFMISLANSKSLQDLTLDDNPLDGFLPDSPGNTSSALERVYASNCKIKGAIPNWMGNFGSLHTLVLVNNEITGSFPNSMRSLQNLQRVNFRGNKMSISLDFFCAFPQLGYLSLGENLIIGGVIPDCLAYNTSMRNLYLSSTGLNTTLPMSIWNLKDLLELNLSSNSLSGSLPPEISNLKMATRIDFSRNYFCGKIPSTIEGLQSLQNFSLAHNQLEGQIPETIGEMLSLEWLDLSYNRLSGPLPMSLEKLQDLTFFNVSYNKLSGEIPSVRPFTNLPAESFISNRALCGDQRFNVPPCRHPSGNKQKLLIILVVVAIIAGIMCIVLIFLKCGRKVKAANGDEKGTQPDSEDRISYYKLLKATEGYNQNNLLGIGSFGSVHKGTLEDGTIVAVKVFNLHSEGSFESFDTECEVLRNLRHRNLTKVISSCSNHDFKALVLEYMSNGNLDRWLYSANCFLNVKQRLDILIDVACALQYLHCGYSTTIAHCDLKPSNVLLDQEMTAHVSDFGMAKLLGHEDGITYTKTLSTLWYVAPEYASEGLISTRCDIYSFGIMMMEVFTGRHPSNEMFGENMSLRSWVLESMPDRLSNVISADLLSTFEKHFSEMLDGICSIMNVALICTHVNPRERSNIEEVLASLNKIRRQLLPYMVEE
ncbi:OLC1v1030905C1 [Oldenlandia corymbosa var. corymbosa]|uniref:non-specific serine/threonine protein kinase n=1 Tax=Oldenlandia corymbosa var. corymbosa TaxID=529605 RepID=A0AAV1CJ28_OLDCO|nr:OLC1v1030905C1 [Oldenlandia corymbosa var. corymbosa]